MRTKNSLKNMLVSFILGLVVIIVNFIVQKIFLETLGVELLGVNGLFTNIVAMLAVAELGLGSAVIYHLYKPLHTNNTERISSLMRFYKMGYGLVALSIILLGICLLPFLPMIVGDTKATTFNLSIVFLLFIINAATSYLLSYKRSVLYADQKSYIINTVHLLALIALNGIQIGVLLVTGNFYLFLILKIIFTLIENIILNHIVNKRYTLNASPQPISKKLRRDIFQKIKGLLFHKISGFITTGSTNIIISSFLGIATVGLYSNYLLIQTALSTLFMQASGAIRASIGNLLVAEKREKSFIVFNRLQFAGQFLSVLCASTFLVASGGFISLWIGKEFVFSFGLTVALTINIYLYLIRWMAFHNFKEAAGVFYEDRFVPLIEVAINIVVSVILVQFMGLGGVFIGAALSSLAVHAYSYPKFVYKGILDRSYKEYAQVTLLSFAVAAVALGAAWWVSTLVSFNSAWIDLGFKIACATIIPAVTLAIVYKRSEAFKYYTALLRKVVKR